LKYYDFLWFFILFCSFPAEIPFEKLDYENNWRKFICSSLVSQLLRNSCFILDRNGSFSLQSLVAQLLHYNSATQPARGRWNNLKCILFICCLRSLILCYVPHRISLIELPIRKNPSMHTNKPKRKACKPTFRNAI